MKMSDEQKCWVIKYKGSTTSYFRGWADAQLQMTNGRTRGLPAFGATLDKAARFESREDAEGEIHTMPFMAGLMCITEEVDE